MSIANKLERHLKGQSVDYELVPHHHTESSLDSAASAHIPATRLAKAVIVKDGDAYLMVVVPGDQWLKLEALGEELNRRLELADEREVAELFVDCEPGSVPPLGEAYGMEAVLDEALTSLANVYIEVGDHGLLAHLSGEAFLKLTRGLRRGHFSHRG